MISNTGARFEGGTIGVVNSDAEFAAYDALPHDLRRMIDECPVKAMAASVFEVAVSQGIDAAYAGLRQLVHNVCPGYRPLPKPRKRHRTYR